MDKLEKPLKKYRSLGKEDTKEARFFDRVRFSFHRLEQTRVDIYRQVSYLSQFRNGLQTEPLSRIERILGDDIKSDRPKRAPSIIAVRKTESERAWTLLVEELAPEGFSHDEITQHKDTIKNYIRVLVSDKHSKSGDALDEDDNHLNVFLSRTKKVPAESCGEETTMHGNSTTPESEKHSREHSRSVATQSTSSLSQAGQRADIARVETAVALYTFESQIATDLNFLKGDVIEYIEDG